MKLRHPRLKLRAARKEDTPEILKVLKELDMFYPTQSLKNFWLAERNGKILGVVNLEEFDSFFFLSSLGVKKMHQKQGIATFLLNKLLKPVKKNVYLYTFRPEFFKRFGFKIVPPLTRLPSKNRLQCEYCSPEKCVCMLKLHHAS